MSFIEELKRRNVFKVGIAYAVGGWLLLQMTEVLSELLKLPDTVGPIVVSMVAIGFPIAIFLAWAFEMTPDGVKREADVDRSQSVTPQTGKKLNQVIFAMMALAVVYLLFDKFSGPELVSTPAVDTASSSIQQDAEPAADSSADTRQSIAVLPFDNRSNREEDQFFTDGIHDDLLTTIAQIGSMKVISRTSVMEYKGTTKNIREIAAELGVTNILEGGIQRSGNQVRINVQLIDARTDEHLWAEIFDRELTAENLFAIQSEISNKIAQALQATLSPQEQNRINAVPTNNLAAYDAYLRGRQLMATRQSEELEQAKVEFNKAVELDSRFALAWVGVADINLLLSSYGTLRREDSFSIREDALNRALAIDEQLGEAYASRGTLYHHTNRLTEAETAYRKALELSPNYATAYHWYANFLTSFPLRSRQALEMAYKAAELDPRSMIIGIMLGGAYASQGLYSLAERQFQKVAELNPGSAQAHTALTTLYTFATGEFNKAISAGNRAIILDPGNAFIIMLQALTFLQLGDTESAEALRIRIERVDSELWTVGWTDLLLASANNNSAAVNEALSWVLPKLRAFPGFAQRAGAFALAHGDKDRAREIYLGANSGWLEPGQWQGLIGQYANDACIFSWVLINTGDQVLGTQLLNQTIEYLDVDLAAVNEHIDAQAPEICYLSAGDKEKALDSIETQLAHNHIAFWDTQHQLPMYDLIRFEPRYQAAIAERERRIAIQRESLAQMNLEKGP